MTCVTTKITACTTDNRSSAWIKHPRKTQVEFNSGPDENESLGLELTTPIIRNAGRTPAYDWRLQSRLGAKGPREVAIRKIKQMLLYLPLPLDYNTQDGRDAALNIRRRINSKRKTLFTSHIVLQVCSPEWATYYCLMKPPVVVPCIVNT